MKKIMILLLMTVMLSLINPTSNVFAAYTVTTDNGNAIIYARNATYTESFLWTDGYSVESSTSDTSGKYLKAANGSSSTPSGSKLSFKVTADKAGRYVLWIRTKATDSNGATWFDYGDNGYERLDLSTGGSWEWKKIITNYYMNAGETLFIEFYPKDSGHCIDEFIFTDKAAYTPSGVVTNSSTIVNNALSASWGSPTIFPPANTHPRLMIKAGDIQTIKINSAKSQNSAAKTYFDSLVATSFMGTRTVTDYFTSNYSTVIENYIEANAFYYALYGNTEKGRLAVTELLNYLRTVRYNPSDTDVTRNMGCTVFKAAEVYDWCFALLTADEKAEIISQCEGIMTGMEIGYPQTGQGNVTGHGSEAQLLRDMLAFSVAVYDERPDIYNHIMGRIQNQIVPARNFMYKSGYGYQGTSYSYYRYYWELWAQKIVEVMSGQSLFSDDFENVALDMIYNHRPDGRRFIQGDDSSLGWSYYNGYSFFAAKFAADLFDNSILKGEYRYQRGSEKFSNTNYNDVRSFNSVLWLIMNNPNISYSKDRSGLPESKYFGSPGGIIFAKTGWNYNYSTPTANNQVSAMMKIGEYYGANHDHLDAGTFQLYYKGILASDSGVYKGYGSDHDTQYYKRTAAHNAITIYDENESFNILGTGTSNDGGQLWRNEALTFETFTNGNYKRASVLDHEIAPDNSYSYIKGDITAAYSADKASSVIRNMCFIPTENTDFPAIMVVYDNVVSKTSSQIKKFLLHTQAEPSISGATTTVVNNNTTTWSDTESVSYNGKLIVNTLLPKNPSITKIGGNGNQYSINGTNYPPSGTVNSYSEAGWGRVEIKAATEGTKTEFLNVLAVTDGGSTAGITSNLIEGTNVVGVQTLDKVVIFSNSGNRVQSSAAFTVSGSGTDLDINVFGVKEGRWIVKNNGNTVAVVTASDEGGALAFKGDAGKYTISFLNSGELVASYDYRNNTGNGITDLTADVWSDLSGKGNNISLYTDADNYWTGSTGFHATGGSGNAVYLPQAAVDAINGEEFTLSFVVSNVNQLDNTKCVSLFGNVKNQFAIYKISDASKIYIKMPGWRTILTRPYRLTSRVDGTHNIITVNRQEKTIKWYIDGSLVDSREYTYTGDISDRIQFVSDGGSVDYKMIKLFGYSFTDDDAAAEYQSYVLN